MSSVTKLNSPSASASASPSSASGCPAIKAIATIASLSLAFWVAAYTNNISGLLCGSAGALAGMQIRGLLEQYNLSENEIICKLESSCPQECVQACLDQMKAAVVLSDAKKIQCWYPSNSLEDSENLDQLAIACGKLTLWPGLLNLDRKNLNQLWGSFALSQGFDRYFEQAGYVVDSNLTVEEAITQIEGHLDSFKSEVEGKIGQLKKVFDHLSSIMQKIGTQKAPEQFLQEWGTVVDCTVMLEETFGHSPSYLKKSVMGHLQSQKQELRQTLINYISDGKDGKLVQVFQTLLDDSVRPGVEQKRFSFLFPDDFQKLQDAIESRVSTHPLERVLSLLCCSHQGL